MTLDNTTLIQLLTCYKSLGHILASGGSSTWAAVLGCWVCCSLAALGETLFSCLRGAWRLVGRLG